MCYVGFGHLSGPSSTPTSSSFQCVLRPAKACGSESGNLKMADEIRAEPRPLPLSPLLTLDPGVSLEEPVASAAAGATS